MRVTFHGVRGFIPSPGPGTNRYGGNTPCIHVATSAGAHLVLDAGTGLAVLGRALMAGPFGRGEGELALLLSHTHWDHIQGFPFFPPAYVPGNRFVVYGPSASPGVLESTLEGQMAPHFSPICSLRNLGAQVECREVCEGESFAAAGARVVARANPHGGSEALAYRIDDGGVVLAYASDAGYPDGVPSGAVAELYRGADLLVHDCTFTVEDRAPRIDRGCASVAEAARAAAQAGVKRLALFHYDPDYDDDRVDALAETARAILRAEGKDGIEVIAASEGLTVEL